MARNSWNYNPREKEKSKEEKEEKFHWWFKKATIFSQRWRYLLQNPLPFSFLDIIGVRDDGELEEGEQDDFETAQDIEVFLNLSA